MELESKRGGKKQKVGIVDPENPNSKTFLDFHRAKIWQHRYNLYQIYLH